MTHARETTECRYWPAVGVLLLLAFVGCHESRYAGDGKLTDDRFSPSQRFVLALGPIDLNRQATKRYRLVGLPTKQFTLGFDVSGPRGPISEPLYDARPINSVVHLKLTDEQSRVIIDESGSLNEWVWSGSPHESVSFVYRRGVSRDVPIGEGVVTSRAAGEKADAGWGSFLHSEA